MADQSNREFLTEKLTNYKTFLRSVAKNQEKINEMDAFTIDHFLVFGATTLMPLKTAGHLMTAVDKTMEFCNIDDVPEVRAKLLRYYEFLVAFLDAEKSAYYSRKNVVAGKQE